MLKNITSNAVIYPVACQRQNIYTTVYYGLHTSIRMTLLCIQALGTIGNEEAESIRGQLEQLKVSNINFD